MFVFVYTFGQLGLNGHFKTLSDSIELGLMTFALLFVILTFFNQFYTVTIDKHHIIAFEYHDSNHTDIVKYSWDDIITAHQTGMYGFNIIVLQNRNDLPDIFVPLYMSDLRNIVDICLTRSRAMKASPAKARSIQSLTADEKLRLVAFTAANPHMPNRDIVKNWGGPYCDGGRVSEAIHAARRGKLGAEGFHYACMIEEALRDAEEE